jgi:hypothetical protein
MKLAVVLKSAKPRTKSSKRKKFERVMVEFKVGTLRTSGGDVVTDRAQAVAIAMSEAGM